MHRTLNDIRRDGLEALRKSLGRAGMIRFLQQFETGTGDYAAERHQWVDSTPLRTFKTKRTSRRNKGKG
jgi:hypothetical protein